MEESRETCLGMVEERRETCLDLVEERNMPGQWT
jgi:hypothetical protein